jgi:hypothetical protein
MSIDDATALTRPILLPTNSEMAEVYWHDQAPEFLPTAKITFEFSGRVYWVDVNEYGDATIKCFEGRGELWSARVRPGKTLREVGRESIARHALDDAWVTRLDNALADCRVLVDAGHAPKGQPFAVDAWPNPDERNKLHNG